MSRFLVTRIAPDGAAEWTIDVSARREITEGKDIIVTADGGCLAVGQLDAELYAIRCSAAGDVLWTRALGTEVFDDATAAVELEDGSFVIAGSISLFDGPTKRGIISEKVVLDGYVATWVIRIDGNGDVIWQQAVDVSRPNNSGPLTFPNPALAKTRDGGFVVTSVTDHASRGRADVWLAKYDRSGGIRWQRTLGSQGLNGIQTVVEAANGDLLLGGSIATDAAMQVRGWVGRADADGNLLWQTEMVSATHELWGGSIYERADGEIDYVSMAVRSEEEKSTALIRLGADGSMVNGWVYPVQDRKIFTFSMAEVATGVVLIGYSAETTRELKVLRGWISGHPDVSRTWDALQLGARTGDWVQQGAQFYPADVNTGVRDVAAPQKVAPVRIEKKKN
jgi:hypothetical protein